MKGRQDETLAPLPPASAGYDGRRPREQVRDLRGELGLGRRLLLHPHFRRVGQVHEGLPLRALLEVLAADALADGRAHDLRLEDEEPEGEGKVNNQSSTGMGGAGGDTSSRGSCAPTS